MTDQYDPTRSTRARLIGALELVVKTAAIGVPIFYALGRVFIDSYWGALHLPSSLMGYSIDDYLFFGFVSIILWVSHLLGVGGYGVVAKAALLGLGVGVVAAAAAWVDRWLSRRLGARASAFRARLEEAKQSKHASTLHGLQVGAVISSGISFLLLALLGAVALILLPAVLAAKTGKAQAKIDLAHLAGQYKANEISQPPIAAHYTSGGVRVSAPLLDCSEAWCVVLKRGSVAAIPRADVFAIDQSFDRPEAVPSPMKFPVDTPKPTGR